MTRQELIWRIQKMEAMLNRIKYSLPAGPLNETAMFVLILEENVAILKELVKLVPE